MKLKKKELSITTGEASGVVQQKKNDNDKHTEFVIKKDMIARMTLLG